MASIAGFCPSTPHSPPLEKASAAPILANMLAAMSHRGSSHVATLLHPADLSSGLPTVALAAGHMGQTPALYVDKTSHMGVAFSGHLHNVDELKPLYGCPPQATTAQLVQRAFAKEGLACVHHFRGAFAFAVCDANQRLWLVRDRIGKCPIFYANGPEGFAFASEIKALFAGKHLTPKLNLNAINQSLRFWGPVLGNSHFEGAFALLPGMALCLDKGNLLLHRYWDINLSQENIRSELREEEALQTLDELFCDAVSKHLKTAPQLGAFLSGGLDSSLVCAVAHHQAGKLPTFSVAFEQARFDESQYQQQVAKAIGTEHQTLLVTDEEIGALLPKAVVQAEHMFLRSAPAPFLALSTWVAQHGIQSVLSGEGADEFFWGYDIYKETILREFWARFPSSSVRPKLFARLYPYLSLSELPAEMLQTFYGIGLENPKAWDFSHQIRWNNSGRIARFLSPAFLHATAHASPEETLRQTLPPSFETLPPMGKAQYLEMRTMLQNYLLPTQGESMLAANAIQGCFPFMDVRVVEFAASLPRRFKLLGLTEKYLLRRYGQRWIPPEVYGRPKFPYRAPIVEALLGKTPPPWVQTLLSKEAFENVGVFDGDKCSKFIARLRTLQKPPSEADAMTLNALATTQLLTWHFILSPSLPSPSPSPLSWL
ncbi:MAG: asparagine synthase (glutamine-hydrolyzing) [Proteobacteria bacterium]|nr:asparagine synthase (glutamine-hydrolyzing) [Cystobacterineae bacterium]MCL2259585.1 asparagine synthase (glutamine-hydrolyzing) [Cystobacterineae bacterium]MCL2314344.1 asparagine synthase (glutamine-hydrolyzing) [Pseudomonadota bacterium]